MSMDEEDQDSHGISADDLRTLPQIYRAAESRLERNVWEFLKLGSGANETLADNITAFERWRFRPRVMSGMGTPTLSTRFLGIELAMPIIVAPFGGDMLFHRQGHLAVARANAAHGIASMAPEASSYSLEQIAQAAPAAARICQLHAFGSPDHFSSHIKRAEAAGYEALCVTVDCPTVGWREHLLESGYKVPSAVMSGNIVDDNQENPWKIANSGIASGSSIWNWEILASLCSATKLPFICKGVLTGEDAIAARDSGAAGVIVSNHGGRQLDCVPAALDQLPEVRRAVGTGFPVGVDGGVRRGTDVLKALALGADVVLVGRAIAMGLAAGGEKGVGRVLQLLHDEMLTSMKLMGCESISKIGPAMVQPVDTDLRNYMAKPREHR